MKVANAKIDSYIKNIANEKIAGALVFGPSESVALSRFNVIAKRIVDNLQDQFLVTNLDKERFSNDKSCLADEFYAFSMFGGRKLIIIREPQIQALNSLKALLKDPDEVKKSDNFILILAGDLEKSSALRKLCEADPNIAALACYEDSDFIIKKLIEQRLKSENVEFSGMEVNYLFEILPKNRQIIALEIAKIATYLNGEKLSSEAINKIIKPQNETGFDEFLNNFILKRKKEAIKSLDSLIKSGFEPVMVVRFLTNYLQKLYNAKIAIEKDGENFEIAVKAQRLFFKAEDAFKRQLRAVNLKEIENWLQNLQKIEIGLKGSLSKYSKIALMQSVCEI